MRKNINTIQTKDAVLWVNIVLFGMAALLMFYYVIMANSVTAKNYKVQTLRDKLEVLTEANSSLISKKLALESSASLLEFARSSNLVKAGNIFYIFESKNVAQR